jgi:hypothetical protein
MVSFVLVIVSAALCPQDAAPPPTTSAERGVRGLDAPQGQFRLDYAVRHALVIGIDRYEDPGFPKLSYAVADAKSIGGAAGQAVRFQGGERRAAPERAGDQGADHPVLDGAARRPPSCRRR